MTDPADESTYKIRRADPEEAALAFDERQLDLIDRTLACVLTAQARGWIEGCTERPASVRRTG